MILPAAPKTATAVLFKTLCDQALFAPFGLAMFLGVIRCMEGRPNEAMATVQTQLRPCLKAKYMLWPTANLINFALVPPSQRILYHSVVGVRTPA
jgi:protein Mpv17